MPNTVLPICKSNIIVEMWNTLTGSRQDKMKKKCENKYEREDTDVPLKMPNRSG